MIDHEFLKISFAHLRAMLTTVVVLKVKWRGDRESFLLEIHSSRNRSGKQPGDFDSSSQNTCKWPIQT